MKKRRVVITGMGVISPIGNDVNKFWNNLVNGVCGVTKIESFDSSKINVHLAGEVKDFDPKECGLSKIQQRKCDRFSQFAIAASKQAMLMAGDIDMDPARLGVYIGSGIGGIHTFVKHTKDLIENGPKWISPNFISTMISNMASGNVAIDNNAQGPSLPIVTACATGTHSIGEAFHAIKDGYADAIIAGGSEAAVTELAIAGFANSKALSTYDDPAMGSIPFDKRRKGFVLAEGSGIVVLEEYEHAKSRGAEMYAEIVGYGNTCDAYHFTAPRPDGSCAARSMKQALNDSGFVPGKDLVHINAHGTGTPLNDTSETAAIKLAMGEEEARKAIICSTKSMTGHMLGAAGGVEVIAAALALKYGIVPPTIGLEEPDPDCDLDYTPNKARKANITIALSSSLGFGGHNACVALRKI
ncbi:MAG: beta-ketoacyl-ACP synthase II [Bacteroidales bacterium]